MNKDEKIQIIKKNPIFENLSDNELDKIAEVSTESSYKQGDIIFRENEIADAFYIIVEGIVEILKYGEENRQEILAEKKRNDVFGEMAVIDDLPRSATIRAKTDLNLLKLKKDEFVELLKTFSHISIEIARSICATVRKTNSSYITDLEKRNKQLEAAFTELKKTQEELISSERLSAIGKFSSLIIHDIKNPMSNIRAYTELIKMNNSLDNEKIGKSANIIINEVDRLIGMTSELLEFARGEINLVKIPVNLSSFILTMIDTLKEELNTKGINILFIKNADAVSMIDIDKMKRVFFNLVSNSKDALINGGFIKINLCLEEKWVKITILDNGTGMDNSTLKKIFEPFYTNKKKGTGLGMAIVKSIIESHNGFIKVQSRLTVGTKFEIFLPAV
jgi:signal transduction histidine kinase